MKKYLLGVFAVALAVGFSAFTTKSSAVKAGFKFFVFDQTLQGENPALEADAKDVNNYRIYDASQDVDCEGTVLKVCRIWAEENGSTGKPLIASQSIETNIHNMFVGAAYTNVVKRDE